MAGRTTIGTILGSSNSVEILIYILENPGCRMSDIYREITRNAHTREKVQTLADMGLLGITPTGRGNSVLLSLTEKGERVVGLLLEAESILNDVARNERFRQSCCQIRNQSFKTESCEDVRSFRLLCQTLRHQYI